MSAAATAAVLVGGIVAVVGHTVRPRPERCRRPSPESARRTLRRPRFRRRAPRHQTGDIAAWCDRLARSVRGGNALSTAIRSVDPPVTAAGQFDEIVLALERGVPLERAATVPDAHPDIALVLTVIRACATTGGPAAEPLDRAAGALRARAAESADRRIQSEQSRLSAVVMTILPIAMLLILVATSPPVRHVVLSPAGLVLVGSGSLLNLGGWTWMRRIIRGVAR